MSPIRNKEDQRQHNIEQTFNRCVHYNGLMNPQCEAGVNYAALAETRDGMMRRIPCFRDTWDGSVSCEHAAYPTLEEAAKKEDETEAMVSEYIRKTFTEHICPGCNEHWEGKQVGRCVYCENCGHRLFQGRLA